MAHPLPVYDASIHAVPAHHYQSVIHVTQLINGSSQAYLLSVCVQTDTMTLEASHVLPVIPLVSDVQAVLPAAARLAIRVRSGHWSQGLVNAKQAIILLHRR